GATGGGGGWASEGRRSTRRARAGPRSGRDVAVAGPRDDGAQHRGCDARAEGGGVDGARRRNERAQRAIEPHLAGERASAPAGERGVHAGPAVRQRMERRFGGQVAAPGRDPQAVGGHRIDEAGGVAGEEESVERSAARVDGQRSEDGGRRGERGVRKAIGEQRVRGKTTSENRGRIAELRVAGARWADETDISEIPGYVRDADVAIPAHVHLTKHGRYGGRTPVLYRVLYGCPTPVTNPAKIRAD